MPATAAPGGAAGASPVGGVVGVIATVALACTEATASLLAAVAVFVSDPAASAATRTSTVMTGSVVPAFNGELGLAAVLQVTVLEPTTVAAQFQPGAARPAATVRPLGS